MKPKYVLLVLVAMLQTLVIGLKLQGLELEWIEVTMPTWLYGMAVFTYIIIREIESVNAERRHAQEIIDKHKIEKK